LSSTNFWISPTGDDTIGTGDQIAPWKTVTKARDHIRANGLNVNMTADINANLMAGDYYIASAIAFDETDSGSNGFYVNYRSADGTGLARIHAGLKPTGWTVHSGNIWKVSIGTGQNVLSIYENGKIAWLARSPNFAAKARYPQHRGDYKVAAAGGLTGAEDWIQYNSGDFSPANWTITNAATMVWWGPVGENNWGHQRHSLNSVDSVNRKLFFNHNSSSPTAGERYFVQGIYELLDTSGEFFYDPVSGFLYYWPQAGDPNLQDIRVPQSNNLVALFGSAVGSHVHHLAFVGLAFAYARHADSTTGALMLQSTDHIRFLDCHIYNVGSVAIRMSNDNADNTVSGCWIHNCGVAAIQVVNELLRATYPTGKSERHLITNCKIHDIGEVLVASTRTVGVLLHGTNDCEVSHCEIFNSPRYATSLRGHWSSQNSPSDSGSHFAKNNTFKFIRAYDCMTDSGDGAIVHAAHCNSSSDPLGSGNINFWKDILISGAYAEPSMDETEKPYGIYLDHPMSTEFQNFSNIKIAYTQGLAFKANGNPIQTTSNVTWTGTFNDASVDYPNIGLTANFPTVYDDRRTVIVDDHTADYSEVGTGWIDTAAGGLYKGDGRFHSAGTSSQYAEWRPTLPFAGSYAVYIWKMNNNASATSAARHRIYRTGPGAGSFTTVYINQQTGPSGWISVGTYTFSAGRPSGSGFVRMYADTVDQKQLRADAVKWVYLGP
jgi:hypothetical protein